MGLLSRKISSHCLHLLRFYSGNVVNKKHACKVLIVGGGTGGCSVAWRLSKKLRRNDITVLEPSKIHYYQPHFTLIAAGIKDTKEASKPVNTVLPPTVTWIQDCADEFDPCNNTVYTASGNKIAYDFMVVAVGLKNDYDQVQKNLGISMLDSFIRTKPAKQSYVVEHNLLSTMDVLKPEHKYNGYGACPLVTSYHTCIIAEFLYDGVVHETLPFNQAKERIIAYYMKRDLFPFLYWHFMLKGYYHGPEFIRKIINPFAK